MVSVVAYNPATRAFTAEEPPTGTAEPELSIEVLRLRVRQQELLADFGVLALKGTPFPQLLHEAAQIVADGLKAEFAKVLRYLPEAVCPQSDRGMLGEIRLGMRPSLYAATRLVPGQTFRPLLGFAGCQQSYLGT
jgi:hypothetical protein